MRVTTWDLCRVVNVRVKQETRTNPQTYLLRAMRNTDYAGKQMAILTLKCLH